ncbi:unnamed protein product [Closterium sp. Naga37s-1]|nr:unnamed protein product [Closterium sp. Naga37s-1]
MSGRPSRHDDHAPSVAPHVALSCAPHDALSYAPHDALSCAPHVAPSCAPHVAPSCAPHVALSCAPPCCSLVRCPPPAAAFLTAVSSAPFSPPFLARAAFLTAVASAPIVPPFLLARSALHGGVSTTAPAAQAKPLVWKGRTIYKYVTKLRPTRLNGKVVGDKGTQQQLII